MTATVRYPANDILPHGWYMLTQGNHPSVWLDAYDGSVRIDLMGGLSIEDYYDAPECVRVPRDGLKGLVPPWKHITQKGATQDGVTHLDALIDPNEVELKLRCKGRDGRHVQRVVRHVYGSLDAKRQSRLNFVTLDEGYWWADLRWYQGAPPDPVIGGQQKFQDISLRLLGDRGFWRTYDDVASFEFVYNSVVDNFDTDYSAAHDLGPNWPQLYSGPGAGYCSTTYQSPPLHRLGEARWYESGSLAREVVNGPYKNFSTDTDNQVIEAKLGVMPEATWPQDAYIDIWGRMGRDGAGAWDGNGIRARIGRDPDGLFGRIFGYVQLSRFNSFTETVLIDKRRLFRPHPFEKFTLVCGTSEDEPRMFRVLRDGIPILSHKEVGTNSHLGSTYRGVGFGMSIAQGVLGHQFSPAWVRKFSAADNILVTQSGFLTRTNIGDQPMYDDYTVFGPLHEVRIWDGPNAGPEDFVAFGPLAANQVALLRTDPRDPNVYDLTTVPAVPTQQDRAIFDAALEGFFSFLTKAHVAATLGVVQSLFGVLGGRRAPATPQGNLYRFLTGRFTDASAIPAKSPGNPAQTYYVKVEIDGATADTKVLAAGTPLRRYPL